MTVLKTMSPRGIKLILFLCFLSLNHASKDVVKEFSDEFSWQDSDIPQVNQICTIRRWRFLLDFNLCSSVWKYQLVKSTFSQVIKLSCNFKFQFNNLVVDKNTGRVYIGAVNKLYQLSPDLDLTVAVSTGPREDSPLCSVQPECPSVRAPPLPMDV